MSDATGSSRAVVVIVEVIDQRAQLVWGRRMVVLPIPETLKRNWDKWIIDAIVDAGESAIER